MRHECEPTRLPKARRPDGQISQIRSRVLTMMRVVFMLRGFEYNQRKNRSAMSASSICSETRYADAVTPTDYC